MLYLPFLIIINACVIDFNITFYEDKIGHNMS